MSRRLGLALLAAFLLRLVPILATDRVTADVKRYQRVAAHVLDVSWNPYTAPRLYPYPPVFVFVEAGAEALARRLGASFAVLVKLPVLAADLGLVALLGVMGRARGLGLVPAFLYAFHPVSLLVTGFHGQFDALALLPLLYAVHAFEAGRRDVSALALAGAVAVKSFPVLMLPFFLLAVEGLAARLRFLVLATAPVALMLLPFAIADAPALRRELFGYGGVADFGFIGLVRGLLWLSGGALARSEAMHWPTLLPLGKVAFLLVLAATFALAAARRLSSSLDGIALLVFLGFLTFYGAVSAQYFTWVAPFGVLAWSRLAALHTAAAAAGLVAFYLFLAPGVLSPATEGVAGAGPLWVVGVAAALALGFAWWLALLRGGLRRPVA